MKSGMQGLDRFIDIEEVRWHKCPLRRRQIDFILCLG